MKKISSILTLGLLVSLLCFSSVSAEGPTPAPGKIDLKLSADYFRSWENRERFPENVPFGYYYAYSLDALGEKIDPAVRAKIIKFIRDSQGDAGGFAQSPASIKTTNIVFTHYALKTLDLLNALDAVNKKKAEKFIMGLVQDDGGFRAIDREGEPTSLSMTFYGVESLRILDGLEQLKKEKTAEFVNRHATGEKGFAMTKKGLASTQGTYMAVQTLVTLDNLTDDTRAGVVSYLKGTRYSGLVENEKYQTLPYMKGMKEVVRTLSLLSALNEGNTARMREFVESLYVPVNGGFGTRPGMGTAPSSTFDAIVCLSNLGRLKDPEAPAPILRKH